MSKLLLILLLIAPALVTCKKEEEEKPCHPLDDMDFKTAGYHDAQAGYNMKQNPHNSQKYYWDIDVEDACSSGPVNGSYYCHIKREYDSLVTVRFERFVYTTTGMLIASSVTSQRSDHPNEDFIRYDPFFEDEYLCTGCGPEAKYAFTLRVSVEADLSINDPATLITNAVKYVGFSAGYIQY